MVGLGLQCGSLGGFSSPEMRAVAGTQHSAWLELLLGAVWLCWGWTKQVREVFTLVFPVTPLALNVLSPQDPATCLAPPGSHLQKAFPGAGCWAMCSWKLRLHGHGHLKAWLRLCSLPCYFYQCSLIASTTRRCQEIKAKNSEQGRGQEGRAGAGSSLAWALQLFCLPSVLGLARGCSGSCCCFPVFHSSQQTQHWHWSGRGLKPPRCSSVALWKPLAAVGVRAGLGAVAQQLCSAWG